MRADYLSGRTALHFAAVHGHVRCIRLVVADLIPSAPYQTIRACSDVDKGGGSNGKGKHEQRYSFPFRFLFPKPGVIVVNFIRYNLCLANWVE